MAHHQNIDRNLLSHQVPQAVKPMLQSIALTHNSSPLRAYDESCQYLEPEKVNDALRDCLVELHFTFKHYGIKKVKKDEADYDTFTAEIRQIVVLKKAPPKSRSPYDKSLRGGPVRVKPAKGSSSTLADAFKVQTVSHPLKSTGVIQGT